MKQKISSENATVREVGPAQGQGLASQGTLSIVEADPEKAQLLAQLGELRDLLEDAERRIERQKGERKQLNILLDKRDAQIQQLNRELGTLQATRPQGSAAPAATTAWHQTISAFFGMLASKGEQARARLVSNVDLKRADRAGESAETISQATFDRPPLIANFKEGAPKAVLIVILFGLDDEEIRKFLGPLRRDCAASNMMPLILTDNDSFELLREHRLIFEYLPPVEDRDRFDRRLNWDLYMQRRLAIIRRKWQPTRVIALGQLSTAMLRLWQQSPFEEFPLPASIGQKHAAISRY